MAAVRFRYSDLKPSGPTVILMASSMQGDIVHIQDVPAIVDTGADQTVFPATLIDRLGVPHSDSLTVEAFDGGVTFLPTAYLLLQIRLLQPIELPVIVSDQIRHVILGRDILNRYVITLDGPNERVEITEVPTP